ncbi:MAG TPA: amidohydrolase [Solibacterales bacterium]|nr:amidohydrolase [Bryobacterales bacterium]
MRRALLLLLPLLAPGQTMDIREYEPKSSLVVPENLRPKAKYPIIDAHSHHRFPMPAESYALLLEQMDALNLRVLVNLSGGYGDRLKNAVESSRKMAPGRFVIFASLDFRDIDAPDFPDRVAAQLEQDFKNGAAGLKFFKNFGMDLKDGQGRRIKTDDPRFDMVFQICAQYKKPVLIHTADPKQFWEPVDKFNERWIELHEIPGRRRPPERNDPWEMLIAEQHNLFRKHPKTTFINAHLGWFGGDLGRLGRLLDECPNVYTEIGAVLAELGRQPRFARAWFVKYQDRVLFGKDSWQPTEYPYYFRVLETADEYFDYYRKRHAFWKMYGLDLPDDVLKKLYYKNALRIIPGIDASAFPE